MTHTMLSWRLQANAYAHGIRHTNGPLQEKPLLSALITSASLRPRINFRFPTKLICMTHAAPSLLPCKSAARKSIHLAARLMWATKDIQICWCDDSQQHWNVIVIRKNTEFWWLHFFCSLSLGGIKQLWSLCSCSGAEYKAHELQHIELVEWQFHFQPAAKEKRDSLLFSVKVMGLLDSTIKHLSFSHLWVHCSTM